VDGDVRMTIPNSSSRQCFAYETVPNVAEIVAVNTVTYYFGNAQGDKADQWETPSPEMPSQGRWNYAQKMPIGLRKLDPNYPEFDIHYNPITSQFLARFLGNNATGAPITHDPLNTGEKYSYTYRHEQRGGTTEKLNQAVGCKTVGLTIIGNPNEMLKVTERAAWGYLEDQGDRSILTTNPTAAGALTSGAYLGLPYFEWNTTQLIEIIGFNLAQKQNYHKDYSPSTGISHVYCDKFDIATIVLKAVLHEAISFSMWDDFVDRTTRNALVKFYKPDGVNYVQIDLGSCDITSFKEVTQRDQGGYAATITLTCPDVSGSANFLNEGANFDTHFKAAYA
jgi:hypothetical protein